MPEVKDKKGKPIHEGETVSGKIRGGKHAGEVEAVVTSSKEAAEKGVKNPPKVLIEDQHGLVNGIVVNPRTHCEPESRVVGAWDRSEVDPDS